MRKHRVRKERQGPGIVRLAREGDSSDIQALDRHANDRTNTSIILRAVERKGKDGAATLKYRPAGRWKPKQKHQKVNERQGSGIVLLACKGESRGIQSFDRHQKDRNRTSIILRSGEREGKDGAATLK